MILDALTTAKADNLDDAVILLTDLEKLAKSHVAWTGKTDSLYQKHKYPNSKIKYAKADVSCDIERDLSSEAYRLLGIAYKHMSQENNVELKQGIICDRYGYTKHLFTSAIDELVEKEYLTKIVNRNKEHGNIYQVNSKYYTKGKLNPLGKKEATSISSPDEAEENKVAYHTIHLQDDGYIVYGSIDVG